ncbi:MAG TPA: ribosome biogenesis GTPase Der [Tepidisphaeraceae bacterium]|jgi:GTP-binding protein
MTRLPVVAIVGRPNVGKSSLLNALVGKRISIVQDQPGVTRDRVSFPLPIDGRYIELVDTGGYGFEDPDKLTEHIKQQIERAMSRSDLVLFLVDTQAGLTGGDEQIASLLRRQNLKTVLIANKTDSEKAEPALGDFARLGFGTPIGISALNDRRLDQLLNAIKKNVDLSDAPTEVPEPEMLLAIVGKRNAGKSTLVNAVAKLHDITNEERVIVSDVPGTTRDSIDVRIQTKDGKNLVVIDTAGVRKKRHMVTNDIEFYSFHRAQRSVRRADVVIMLIDGTEHVSEPDKKLAQYIAEQYKPVLLVVNKWDLVVQGAQQQATHKDTEFSEELLANEFAEYLNQELRHLDYAPVVFTSAKTGLDVQQILDVSFDLFKQINTRVATGELNKVLKQIMTERAPSTPSGRRIKVFYVTQSDVAPPTIVMFVNHPEDVNDSYQRFMVNRFREMTPFTEVPIRLFIRGRAGAPSDSEPFEPAQARAKAAAAKRKGVSKKRVRPPRRGR